MSESNIECWCDSLPGRCSACIAGDYREGYLAVKDDAAAQRSGEAAQLYSLMQCAERDAAYNIAMIRALGGRHET